MKFISLELIGPYEYKKEIIEFKSPKVIDNFWYGDSPKNARLGSSLFPDTPAGHEAVDAYLEMAKDMKRQDDVFKKHHIEMTNQKARGELD